MSLKFNVFDSEDLEAEAGKALNNLLAENKDLPVLFLLSAGSSFNLLKEITPENLGEHVTITMLDERFSLDSNINNFSQFQKLTFYETAQLEECNFIGTSVRPGETMENFSQRWENRLREWKQENPDGKLIATFGMGPDGHTAGIFPYPENKQLFEKLFLGKNWLSSYSASGKNKYPERVTTTPEFFKLIDSGIVYISGAEKKTAFEKFKNKSGSAEELPVLLLYDLKKADVYTDIVI